MSIANEINRIQQAKANIKTAIEWKGVVVWSWTKIDNYWTLINDIQVWAPSLFMPTSYVYSLWTTNYWAWVSTFNCWWHMNWQWTIYYRYFVYYIWWKSYNTYYFWVLYKQGWKDILLSQWWAWVDRYYYRPVWFRMKMVWNDVKASLLYYEYTSWSSSAKDHYYCTTATNNSIWERVDCWIIEDIWSAKVYENWTNSCWITESENITSQNYISSITAQSSSTSTLKAILSV